MLEDVVLENLRMYIAKELNELKFDFIYVTKTHLRDRVQNENYEYIMIGKRPSLQDKREVRIFNQKFIENIKEITSRKLDFVQINERKKELNHGGMTM